MNVDYAALAPEIAVATGLSVVLLLDLGLRGKARTLAGLLSIVTLAVAGLLLFANVGNTPRETLNGMFVLDGFSLVFKGLMLSSALIVVVFSMPPMSGHRYEGEYYFLLLCSVLGTMLMPSSRDLLMLFISLELVSAPAFVLAGIRKRDPRSNEAALKFFLFGVLSAAILVYGISLVYGFAGSTVLSVIAQKAVTPEPLLMTGVVFIIAAFGFKISAVPFHFWAPDTYEGSPRPLAAFLSVSSKAAGLVGLLLILLLGLPQLSSYWGPVVAVIAAATMILGNVVALKQRHLIRLLAYSSIAQAGYMLIPLALIRPFGRDPLFGGNSDVVNALTVYLIVYALMNLGAFAVAIGLSRQFPTLLLRDLSGLGKRAPFHAVALATFLLSLAGLPPVAGWVAKLFVFISAVGVGSTTGVVLAAVMVIGSVISLYYYVGIIRALFLGEPEDDAPVRFPALITVAVIVCLVGVVVLGVIPESLARIAHAARIAIF